MYNQLLIFSLLLSLVGCSTTSKNAEIQKFDTPLNQKISEVEKAKSQERIAVFGKCSDGISGEMKIRMESTGVTVHTITGDIFTGEGTPEELRSLAEIEFINQIHLAARSKPL
ncbi:MAG: hypothetical protein EH225_13470 [Calditrichaeota bacterium]|nr:hypothetical protein [Calditrichota bacterium]RQV98356.1 MAG: hypothetical protein EH225_13470 [Calditrichota bacterium]